MALNYTEEQVEMMTNQLSESEQKTSQMESSYTAIQQHAQGQQGALMTQEAEKS